MFPRDSGRPVPYIARYLQYSPPALPEDSASARHPVGSVRDDPLPELFRRPPQWPNGLRPVRGGGGDRPADRGRRPGRGRPRRPDRRRPVAGPASGPHGRTDSADVARRRLVGHSRADVRPPAGREPLRGHRRGFGRHPVRENGGQPTVRVGGAGRFSCGSFGGNVSVPSTPCWAGGISSAGRPRSRSTSISSGRKRTTRSGRPASTPSSRSTRGLWLSRI